LFVQIPANSKELTKSIILQGHLDMVCDGAPDPAKHGVLPKIDKDSKRIFAKDTTLGADNGIGLALMLTMLDTKIVKVIGVFNFKVEKETEIRDATQINFLLEVVGSEKVTLSSEHRNFAWISKTDIDNYNLSEETKNIIQTVIP